MRQSGQPRRWPSPQFLNVSMTISDNTANVRQHTSRPAKHLLRSATLCVGHDCAHYRHILFFFFFIFSLFFTRAGRAAWHRKGPKT